MPALPKTSDEQVVRAARKLIERQGSEDFSMLSVAEAVGVKAPSLYKRFPDRRRLMESVAEDAAHDLRDQLVEADRGRTPTAALTAMSQTYRAFAHKHPRAYALLFSAHEGPTLQARAAAAAPVLARLSVLVGEKHALDAARMLTAFLHGFVSMELAGAFKLGGDVDRAFDYSLSKLLAAL
jgi:AcrR family transcriptional regulator